MTGRKLLGAVRAAVEMFGLRWGPLRQVHATDRAQTLGGSFDELRNCRVFLNRQEVTEDCFFASEVSREVGLFARNAAGQKYSMCGEIAKEYVRGHVVIKLA